MINLAVWGPTKAVALNTVTALRLAGDVRVTVLGNRNADMARGLTFDRVLVLPGADGEAMTENLRVATMATADAQWLDLRG